MFAHKGFTLLEALVVLVLLGLLLALALPSLAAWRENAEYRLAARELVGVLRHAGGEAVTRGLETEVDIDFDRPRYRLRLGNRSNDSTDWELLADWRALPQSVRLASTLNCTKVADGNPATIEYFTYQFNPNGSAGSKGKMYANYLCIQDTAARTRFRLALINKVTGRVAIKGS